MTVTRPVRGWVSPAAWTLYLLVPAGGWGLLHGVPLAPVGAAAIALVWWAWSDRRSLPGRRVAAAAVVVKLVLATQAVEHGLVARQYANAAWQPPLERSTESIWRGDQTRRDLGLAFGEGRGPDLPLSFRNDLRFNYYREDQPSREALPFSIVWEGAIRRAADGDVTLYLAGDGHSTAELRVDDGVVLPPEPRFTRAARLSLTRGWHRIVIRVASPDGLARAFEAGEIVGGELRPFGPGNTWTRTFRTSRMVRDAVARWLAVPLDLGVLLAILGFSVAALGRAIRERRVGRLLWLVAIGEALSFAAPWAGRSPVLSGGDDWLSYEHLARVIALGDPLLLTKGIAPGQGTPFYYQPLYPYFLAATHVLGGDSLFLAVLLQRLFLAASAAWLAGIAARIAGAAAWWPAALAGAALLYLKAGPWASIPLAEPMFIPLLVGTVALLVQSVPEAGDRRLAWTGVVGGLATLARSTLLLAWPFLLVSWVAVRRPPRLRAAAILVTTLALMVGLAVVRNRLVAAAGVGVASSLSINLFLGNPPPQPPPVPPPSRAAWYERLGLDATTRQVAEYAVRQPADFASHLKSKGTYAVGFFDWSGIKPGYSSGLLAWPGFVRLPSTSWTYVLLWVAGIAGLCRLLLQRRTEPALLVLPMLAALSHLAAVVIFFPHIYGDRLILPMYPLLIPYAVALLPLPAAADVA